MKKQIVVYENLIFLLGLGLTTQSGIAFINFVLEPTIKRFIDCFVHFALGLGIYLQAVKLIQKLKILSDYISICAWCGEIDHPEKKLSHGICKKCIEKSINESVR